MEQKDYIALFVIIVVVDLLVRLLISNPMFGTATNKVAAKLF